MTKRQTSQISRQFNHDPFQMVESLMQIANGDFSDAKKNLSVELSFDLMMVFKQTSKLHNGSSLFKNPYMTKIKTNFFGLYNQLYKQPTNILAIKKGKKLSSLELQKLRSGSVAFTGFKQHKCNDKERKLLGCRGNYYVIDTVVSPEVTCGSPELENAFNAKFYLTHSKKYGFKITDVEMSGSRIVLQTFKYIQDLKQQGYKKDAILARFQNLQNSTSSFKFPKRLNHSRSIMAIIESDTNRMPTSL